MIRLQLKGWKTFWAFRDQKKIDDWLRRVKCEAIRIMIKGMIQGPHTGRKWPTLPNRSSFNAKHAEFPAKQSGKLVKSLKSQDSHNQFTMGTNMPYSKYLAEGWRQSRSGTLVAPRRMSRQALEAGLEASNKPMGAVKWARRQK